MRAVAPRGRSRWHSRSGEGSRVVVPVMRHSRVMMAQAASDPYNERALPASTLFQPKPAIRAHSTDPVRGFQKSLARRRSGMLAEGLSGVVCRGSATGVVVLRWRR